MIHVKLEGRLGNQLFQYAFACAMAKRLNTSFRLVGTNFLLPAYFDLPGFNIQKNAFFYWLDRLFDKVGIKRAFTVIDNVKSVKENVALVKDNKSYSGYYQSSSYFKPWIDINKKVVVKPEYVNQFSAQYKERFEGKKIVAVHVRRTDYVLIKHPDSSSENLSLPMRFYEASLEKVSDLESCEVFFLSDDLPFVKNHFGTKPNFHYDANSEIIDLLIMINADVVITANSSFSWWGAYLNNKEDKVVYSPRNWFGYPSGKEYPNGIMETPFTWC